MQAETTEAERAEIERFNEDLWCGAVDWLRVWHATGTEWDVILAATVLAMRGQSTRKEAGFLASLAETWGWPAVVLMVGSAMRESE